VKLTVYTVFYLVGLVFLCSTLDPMLAKVNNVGRHKVTRKNFTLPHSVMVGDWEIRCNSKLWRYLKVGSEVGILEKRGFFGVYERRITID
jgi:hypothetical protein